MSDQSNQVTANIDYGERSSVFQESAAAKRERAEPTTEANPISLLTLLTAAMVLSAGFYFLGANSGGFEMSRLYVTDNYSPAPRPEIEGAVIVEDTRTWIEKWMDDGKSVYTSCAACHQANGQGVPGQFPPLADAEWVTEGTERLAALLFPGIQGPLTVKGELYNNLMPAQGAILTNKELAQVMTYIRRSWGNDESVVTEEMVAYAREKYGSRSTPWTESELLEISPDAMLAGSEVDLETGEPLGAEEG